MVFSSWLSNSITSPAPGIITTAVTETEFPLSRYMHKCEWIYTKNAIPNKHFRWKHHSHLQSYIHDTILPVLSQPTIQTKETSHQEWRFTLTGTSTRELLITQKPLWGFISQAGRSSVMPEGWSRSGSMHLCSVPDPLTMPRRLSWMLGSLEGDGRSSPTL